MTTAHDPVGRAAVPPVAEMMLRYLRDAAARPGGPALADGEVVPHEAGPPQPVDPRLAWDEAREALAHCGLPAGAVSVRMPADWAALAAQREPLPALPLCLGSFPQLVRQLAPLLREPDLARLRPTGMTAGAWPALKPWANQAAREGPADALLAAGVLRLAGLFDEAGAVIETTARSAPAGYEAACANERAALAWHRGRHDEAAALWSALPANPAAAFNRGMAALFAGDPAGARRWLGDAAGRLPETGAWHHLARLYLALADMRGR